MKTKIEENTKDKENKQEPQTEPCVFNCDYCPDNKFFSCKEIGQERI